MFKVVKIIDDKNIVVNAGKHVVHEGDTLRIIVPSTEEVIDPDTHKSLGTLNYVKAKISVKTVYDNMCICTGETETRNVLDNPFSREYTPSLNVDLTQVTGGYKVDNPKICVGDIVEKI